MSNIEGVKYKRGVGLVQDEEMDCQGGSAPDDLSFHLMNNKWRKIP